MFSQNRSLFGSQLEIAHTCDVVFVSDMFASDYAIGGAELTSQALINACPLEVFKLHSRDVSLKLLEQGHNKFWVFGNFSQMDMGLIPTIVANMRYSVIEFDFKLCKYRSRELHMSNERRPCDCHNQEHGKLVSAFFYGAKSLFWMAERQQQTYHDLFPFLAERPNCVLSSVFDDETFARIKLLRSAAADKERKGYVIIGSPSHVKGADAAKAYCEREGLDYEVVWGLSHEKLLEKLSTAKGHVCLPKGGDTCPRVVIEARLLGCDLILNENVLHAKEEWFDTDDTLAIEQYLYAARSRFWNGIKHDMEYKPTLSGYTTARNCIEQDYPYEATITSMLGFCDEVCVVDGGSTDGTLERLQKWAAEESRLKVLSSPKDWSHPRFALFDGKLKAEARAMCTGDFCWQMDSDEVVHERDYDKIRDLIKNFPSKCVMLALPVLEFWGGPAKVRADINIWKWRVSRNHADITHGVPKEQRRFDSEGRLYSAGSDGCDPVHRTTFEPVPYMTFVTPDVDVLRMKAVHDTKALESYTQWLQSVADQLPVVQHFSWWNIARKIRTYRGYWSRHWESCFGKKAEDTAGANMFLPKKWADVTEDEIDTLASRLKVELGGWIFHSRVDFTQPTLAVEHLQIDVPECIKDWCERNMTK